VKRQLCSCPMGRGGDEMTQALLEGKKPKNELGRGGFVGEFTQRVLSEASERGLER